MTDHYPALRQRERRRLTVGGVFSAIVFMLVMLYLMWLPVYWQQVTQRQQDQQPQQHETLLCDEVGDGVQVCTEFRRELAGKIKPRQVM
ncbi:hypothetical protein [Chitiniphilus shinanonensis]|uniref:hypothetical protein n=1 Tax=Chitiniphilus shinanonensis TaxID=553088 RepID=UPI0030643F5D